MNALEVNAVSKHFGGLTALQDCSLDVKKGSITGLIGPNGSGKTTLFNVISQLHRPDSGEVIVNGKNIPLFSHNAPYKVASLGISRTFQQVRLFRNLSIKQHVELVLNRENTLFWKNFFSREPLVTEKQILRVLTLVGLEKDVDVLVVDLSYGQRKLLDLAIAIARPHSILLLDEPVAGVNPKLRKQIMKVLKNLNKKGETILFIEHDMKFTMNLAHTIHVLDSGTVIAHGTPKKIQSNTRVLEAYLGN